MSRLSCRDFHALMLGFVLEMGYKTLVHSLKRLARRSQRFNSRKDGFETCILLDILPYQCRVCAGTAAGIPPSPVPQLSQVQFSSQQQRFQGVEDTLGAHGQVELHCALGYGWTR